MRLARWTPSVLIVVLGLLPAACDGGGQVGSSPASPVPGVAHEASAPALEALADAAAERAVDDSEQDAETALAEIDAADIPSQDAADAAAAEAIDQDNADAAFEALAAEIEADG